MSAGHDSGMTPQAAATEIGRTARQVRRRARRQGWLFLAVAAVDFGFYIAVGSAGRAVSRALSPLSILLVAGIFLVASRQPVVGRDAARINKPVVVAGLATAIAGLVLYQTVIAARVHRLAGPAGRVHGHAVPGRGVALAPLVKTGGSHPRYRLDEVIHAPVRLSIMSALAAADRADFRFLRELAEVGDSLLS